MERLRDVAKETSPTFYLTLVSIIASLALGYLLTTVDPRYLFGPDASLLYWLQVLAALQAIILMWHEYVMGAICFKWVLNYIDSLVPFLLGITLFAMVATQGPAQPRYWFFAAAAFTLVSMFAYLNQRAKCASEAENHEVILRIADYHGVAITASGASTIIFVLSGILVSFAVGAAVYLVGLVNLVLLGYAIRSQNIWRGVFRRVLENKQIR